MATFPSKVNYATGDILTATNMNDVGGAINLLDGAQFASGKNKVLNADMGIWQRGTSLSNAGVVYGADRWQSFSYSGSSSTIAQQTFTPGTAPVAGYEGQYFLRCTSTNTQTIVWQNMEDVRTFAGQTVTLSFWAKVASATNVGATLSQQFGSGGSTAVTTTFTIASAGATTSWQRFTSTLAVPSISGKTIGTSSYLQLNLFHTGINNALDIWGVQLEAGNTASNFQTATGTKQGELAACQRYYVRFANGSAYSAYGYGISSTTAIAYPLIALPTAMRIAPTTLDYSTLQLADTVNAGSALTNLTVQHSNPQQAILEATVAPGITQYRTYQLRNANSTSGYLGLSAEL
jgi:hypothetical protein